MQKSIIIDQNSSRKELDEALAKLPEKHKGINLKKYFGKIKFRMDGLEYQKKIRNEWR
jgi:hypothetical protein